LFSGSNGSRLNRWLTVIGKRMLRPIRGGVIDIPLMALCRARSAIALAA